MGSGLDINKTKHLELCFDRVVQCIAPQTNWEQKEF